MVVSNKSINFALRKQKELLTVPDGTQNKKKMKKAIFSAALFAIASANVDGFTVDAKTLKPVTKGYAVAVAATQNSFNKDGLDRVINYVFSHKEINAFGGWFKSENGRYYYDAIIIVGNLKDALELARRNGQIAIFHLDTLTEIKVK